MLAETRLLLYGSRLNREAFVGGRIGVVVMDRSCAEVVGR